MTAFYDPSEFFVANEPSRVPVGNVGKDNQSYFDSVESQCDSDFPANPTVALSFEKAIYPEDSILEDWMLFARKYAESADCYLIGSILPMISALMARNIWFQLDRTKYPNLFVILTGKPGDRKTTAIKLAERVGKRLLPKDCFSPATTSLEGLFDQYDENSYGRPDKLLIADDANCVLANWAESSYGKMVSKKYLELYDCGELRECFRKNEKDGESSQRLIEETSTSILFGSTFNVCRFSKLDVKDGMSRRFLYYVAQKTGRFIPIPPQIDDRLVGELALKFEPLRELKGQVKLSKAAEGYWNNYRKELSIKQNSTAMTEANYTYLTSLSEAPSHIIKLAIIFQACRYAKKMVNHWNEISLASLECATKHVEHCINGLRSLDSISERSIIEEEAETILANIKVRFKGNTYKDVIYANKTELTNAFAKNPGRHSGLKPTRLYNVLFPFLINAGKAKVIKKDGKTTYLVKG